MRRNRAVEPEPEKVEPWPTPYPEWLFALRYREMKKGEDHAEVQSPSNRNG